MEVFDFIQGQKKTNIYNFGFKRVYKQCHIFQGIYSAAMEDSAELTTQHLSGKINKESAYYSVERLPLGKNSICEITFSGNAPIIRL